MHNNQMSEKINLIVLYGGRSSEHEVSIISAASIISNVDRDYCTIVPVGIDRDGTWWFNPLAEVDPLADQTLLVQSDSAVEIEPIGFLTELDNVVVFPVLHGPYGEDGTVQGLLEMANVPYVGSGILSSAVCMDKDIAKRLLLEQGLPAVPYLSFQLGTWQKHQDDIMQQVAENLGEVVFVKPANMGSSVGCSKVKTSSDLAKAVEYAFQFDTKVIVETAIAGREIECAVLENPEYGEPPLVSLPGELITRHEFYDYQAKYHDDTLQLITPAELEADLQQHLQQLASDAFECLACEGMARVDFFVDEVNDAIYINELNTIPGFTHVSMYPMMWQSSGLAFSDLITTLVELAIDRYQRVSQLTIESA